MPEAQSEFTIETLGHLGDGMVRQNGRTVIVPHALPGERYARRGDKFTRLSDSENRIDPICPHFGTCGGCALQHVRSQIYLDFKRNLVTAAFKRARIDDAVTDAIKPCLPCPPQSRRRVTFSAQRVDGAARLGFLGRGSHSFVPVDACPIADPQISESLPTLAGLASHVLRGSGDQIQLLVTACENGLDLAVESDADPSTEMLAALVRALARSEVLRTSVNGDIVYEREKPIVRFGNTTITPPTGGFLQAVPDAEEQMARLVTAQMAKCKSVADLFCGSGTFAHRIAKKSRVDGFENAASAIKALTSAQRPSGAKPVTGHVRDLYETPLTTRELRAFDGVVLDPPRAGAALQCEELGRSQVPKIAYVSCNPVTLAEDLALLTRGGYVIKTVQPVDQFLYAPHVEVVALLEKPQPLQRKSIFGRKV